MILSLLGSTFFLALHKPNSWQSFYIILGVLGFGIAAKDSKVDYLKNQLEDIKWKKQGFNDSLPSLIVFNLNHTLWPFTMDMVRFPIEKTKIRHEMKDKAEKRFSMFPEVYVVLKELNRKSYNLGALVEKTDFENVEKVSSLFGINEFFNYTESEHGTKTDQILRYFHRIKKLQRLSEQAKVPLEEMLYFDSKRKILESMKTLNVTCIWVHPQVGFTYPHLEEGLRVFKFNYKIRNNLITTTTLPTLATRRRAPR